MQGISDILPVLIQGLGTTLQITAASAACAVPVALLAGLARLAPWRLVSFAAIAFIEVFRGTSALVQLFWFYFVLPLLGVDLPATLVAVIVLALNTGAYGAEVVRGAIQAIPESQREAATALSLTPAQTMMRVVLPQAALAMVPPAGNLLIELLKNTALVSLVTITDLTFSAQILRAETLHTERIFGAVLFIYFAVSLLVTIATRSLERTLGKRLQPGGP